MAASRKEIPYGIHAHEDSHGVFHQSVSKPVPLPDPTKLKIVDYSQPFRCDIKNGKVRIFDAEMHIKNGKKKPEKSRVIDHSGGWPVLPYPTETSFPERHIQVAKSWLSQYVPLK